MVTISVRTTLDCQVRMREPIRTPGRTKKANIVGQRSEYENAIPGHSCPPTTALKPKYTPEKRAAAIIFIQGLCKNQPLFAMSSCPKYNVRTPDITLRSALAVVRNEPSGLKKQKGKSRMLTSRIGLALAGALVIGSSLIAIDPASAAGGCGPGWWRGPWGHCRNTPYTGSLPNGGYQVEFRPADNGCPPGYWHGPYGHCRNTPFHGRLPNGNWK